MTLVEGSFCRPKTLAAMSIRPLVIGMRKKITDRIGSSVMMTLRKMMPSSTTISTSVARPTIASALLPDWIWS